MDLVRPNREPLVAPGQIDHHVADLSAAFSADVTLAQAQAKLCEHGQWLPIDGDVDATLGELVERNSTGPLRLGFGGLRDVLLGVQFLNGTGELITAGGRTVKNVAGYDLTKFMVGQFGTFGKIVTVTTRTYKAPEHALLAAFDADITKLNTLLVTPCRPQWAVLTRQALLCGYLGDRATTDFYANSVPEHGSHEVIQHSLEDDIVVRQKLWTRKVDGLSFRASVPPAKITEFAQSAGITDWSADAAFGIVVGTCENTAQDALQKAVSSSGGSVIVFDASNKPLNLKLDPGTASLLRRLKSSFDPNNTLARLPIEAS